MKLLLLLIIIQTFKQIQGQCSGGIWPIQDTSTGSFTILWRYHYASNTIQFILQGQAIAGINLTSTYFAIGWSDAISTMNDTDLAMFFPGTYVVQDRYSREHPIPSMDNQQDFCLIQMNTTAQNVFVSFERSVITGDIEDINLTLDVYLIFAMGSYTISNETNTFHLQDPFYHKALDTNVKLMNCLSTSCFESNCSNTTCPCLQEIGTNLGHCTCFPPSSCSLGSSMTSTTDTSLSALVTGSCANQTNPCSSNGVCLQTSPTHFICQCKPEYTGVLCQVSLFSSNINMIYICRCFNGGSCLNNGTCSCLNGYMGTQCELINSCLSNPCNRGTCVVSSNCLEQICGYSCLCSNGTRGTNCESGANPCWNNPCQNNGSCSASSSSYLCRCIPPYGGANCDSIINVCTPNPCLNNGNCFRDVTMQEDMFRCECPTEYIGTRCEYVSACQSSPCRNGAQCVSSTSNCSSGICPASCVCLMGTNGVYCEEKDSSCTSIACLNGGSCLINAANNISYCQCPANTTGDRCEMIHTTCTTSTCSNHGVCFIDSSSANSTTRCICSKGFTGHFCEHSLLSVNSCSQNPCGYNGTCIQTSNSSYYCICPNGFTGPSCNSNTLGSCASSPCRYLSTCQQVANTDPPSYKCLCPDYLTGDRCQYTNTCRKQPCSNQGSCIPLGPQNTFMCLCPPGFGHHDCSIYLGLSCDEDVCLNGGICDDSSTKIRCACPADFAGPRCEWISVCSANTCQNGGTCRQIAPTMAECLCQTGFTGPTCNLRDSCATSPCKNGGGCTTLLADTGTNWSAYRCVCPPGIYGQTCDTVISSCSNMVCPAYKICSEQATGPICTCSGDRVGTFCQYADPCSSSTSICQNGGTCVSSNTDPPISSCLCSERFTGRYCEQPIENNPCTSNPCQTRGHCALSSSNQSFICVCQENFIGEQCERSNPCSSSPCLNQGICQANWNRTDAWFTCRCVGTYTGQRCETSMLNPCGGLCMNGSPCNNGMCVCPAQYTGTFCGFDNPCYNPICRNGGTCSIISNSTSVSFTCTCPSSYTGQYCETSLNTQKNGSCSAECMHGGSCVNGICVCTPQYVGSACQYGNPCNQQNPCLNSGTCFGRSSANGTLSTQCFCLEGFTGNYCEARLCSLSSCNGGVCRATQNSIVCICPTGKFGDRCQYKDACATNPCSSTERCEQIGGQYQCVSCFDKSSYCSIYQLRNEYCDNRYTILIDENFLPVPQACQRSCGQCISVQRLQDISSLFTNSTSLEMTKTTSTVTIISDTQQTKCIDHRQDCAMQKVYGFCQIFNEKYPEDCVKTCHPDCAHLS